MGRGPSRGPSTTVPSFFLVKVRTALNVTGPEFIRLVASKELWKFLDPLTEERNRTPTAALGAKASASSGSIAWKPN